MSIEPEEWRRKTFTVRAIQVTADNAREVAEWCGGYILNSSKLDWWDKRREQNIVVIQRPDKDEKEEKLDAPLKTFAFVGDYVLRVGYDSFRVYKRKSFLGTFERRRIEMKRKQILDLVTQTMLGDRVTTDETHQRAMEVTNKILKLV